MAAGTIASAKFQLFLSAYVYVYLFTFAPLSIPGDNTHPLLLLHPPNILHHLLPVSRNLSPPTTQL